MYTPCLLTLTACFFSLNHQNYALWLVKYYDNLLKLSITHPEVHADFVKGLFGIQRTTKPFSSLAIDLTLEQTINASSASQRHGTLSMSNSVSARQRWAESNHIKSVIMLRLLDDLSIGKQENTAKELRESSICKDNVKVRAVKTVIEEMNNPFAVQVDKDFLFNITTGKAASESAKSFLLNFLEIGQKKREEFISECVTDPTRFNRSITRTKIATFATDLGAKKLVVHQENIKRHAWPGMFLVAYCIKPCTAP